MSAPTAALPKGVTEHESGNTHNYPPQPIREITEHEFWHLFSSYGVGRREDFRQVRELPGHPLNGGTNLHNIHIFWYSDCAVAVCAPRLWRCGDEKKGEPSIVYTEPARFYRVGCDHKWKETYKPKGTRDHWREETCELCGAENKYDCSG